MTLLYPCSCTLSGLMFVSSCVIFCHDMRRLVCGLRAIIDNACWHPICWQVWPVAFAAPGGRQGRWLMMSLFRTDQIALNRLVQC